jgi:diketogulonate reductase-like aldo/keto reductase
MELNLNSRLKLNNNIEIPIIGLGTWAMSGKQAYQAVLWALEAGYRLIDTATLYGNESVIGEAIRDSEISREEIFITTKVWNSDHGFEKTIAAFEKSLKKLDLSYLDLYLIHWPATNLRNESWRALEKIYKEERVRAIGVCNYTIRYLKELFDYSSIFPSINQVEFSPFLYQKELLDFCKQRKITVEAYCPLTRSTKMDNPILISMGKKYNKTAAQVMLRWGLQHGIIQIPKSANKNHLYENIDIFNFVLSNEDIEHLDSLNENYRVVDDSIFWE